MIVTIIYGPTDEATSADLAKSLTSELNQIRNLKGEVVARLISIKNTGTLEETKASFKFHVHKRPWMGVGAYWEGVYKALSAETGYNPVYIGIDGKGFRKVQAKADEEKSIGGVPIMGDKK
jgi:hypothetical protein